ncbi:hypothetical protein D3C80_1739610 [compost metagenome]
MAINCLLKIIENATPWKESVTTNSAILIAFNQSSILSHFLLKKFLKLFRLIIGFSPNLLIFKSKIRDTSTMISFFSGLLSKTYVHNNFSL